MITAIKWVIAREKRYAEFRSDSADAETCYRPVGKAWPLLSIALFRDTLRGGIEIAINRKEDAESWWTEAGLPKQLIGDLIVLLEAEQDRRLE